MNRWLDKFIPFSPILLREYTYISLNSESGFYTKKEDITTAKYGMKRNKMLIISCDKYSKEEAFTSLLHYSDLLWVLQALI